MRTGHNVGKVTAKGVKIVGTDVAFKEELGLALSKLNTMREGEVPYRWRCGHRGHGAGRSSSLDVASGAALNHSSRFPLHRLISCRQRYDIGSFTARERVISAFAINSARYVGIQFLTGT